MSQDFSAFEGTRAVAGQHEFDVIQRTHHLRDVRRRSVQSDL